MGAPKAQTIRWGSACFNLIGTAIGNGEHAFDQLAALKSAGIRIAVDDFGTGYSSVSYLKRIPAHCVKIDRSFLQEFAPEGRDRHLMASMITMLHRLDFGVVAEGVETSDAYEWLASVGCDEAQGYFLARPLSAADFISWLQQRRQQTAA